MRCRACWSCRSLNLQVAVGVVVGRLGVADPLPEEAGLDRVRPHDLGDCVADAGHPLVGVETGSGTARFESAGIEDQRGFLRWPNRSAKRRNLCHAVLVQALVVVADRRAIHLGGIREHVRETDVGVAEDELVGHRRAEHVGQRGRDGIRLVLALHRSRIRNLVALRHHRPTGNCCVSRCRL